MTRFGKPVADVVPPAEVQVDRNAWIGSGHGTAKILGDIISPAGEPEEWEALAVETLARHAYLAMGLPGAKTFATPPCTRVAQPRERALAFSNQHVGSPDSARQRQNSVAQ